MVSYKIFFAAEFLALYWFVFAMVCADEHSENSVIRLGRSAIWPIRLIIFLIQAAVRGIRHLFVDACALIPTQKAKPIPKEVTVEMLAVDSEQHYQAGQWMK